MRYSSEDVRFLGFFALALLLCPGCSDKHAPVTELSDAAPSTQPIPIDPPPASAEPSSVPSTLPSAPATTTTEEIAGPVNPAPFDQAIRGAIERNEIPGAVLLVLRHGQVVLRRSYGFRAKEPAEVRMTTDTIFDLASLTKPIVTATSILLLADRGKLRLRDPIRSWFPHFHPDKLVTVEHLLLHLSGLPAGNARADHADTRTKALDRILETPLEREPGETYIYSDLGYVLLGQIVEIVSGEALDAFAKKNIFDPLGMSNTMFRPPATVFNRIAPTTRAKDEMLVGVVHDPLSRTMGGVAGHAGLFSTADDLSRFVLALQHKGELDGKQVLPTKVVKQLLDFRLPSADKEKRSLGLGTMFEGIGHTGFTGTAFWIDSAREHAVVLLTNAVHPDGKGRAKQVRQDIARAAIFMAKPATITNTSAATASVSVGIDELEQTSFALLEDRKIGLITNHTGKNARGERTIDVLVRQPKLSLVTLFTPEHGLTGSADGIVGNGKDPTTGLTVVSLYGKDKRPPDAAFANLDALVFDIQDAGTRFYTYITTLGFMMEEAAKRKLRFVVLDRPNPVGGVALEGPLLDPNRESFVGYHSIPIRHGMTVGELARLFNAERHLGTDLHIVPMKGWKRSMIWSNTGLSWVPPSPNLRSPIDALLYPGVGLLETTNLSVGRGTSQPFEVVGAPYIDGEKLAAALKGEPMPGVRLWPHRFKPESSTFANEECGGVRIEVTNLTTLEPVRLGLTIAVTLRRLYPTEWKTAGLMTLLGNARVFEAIVRGENVSRIVSQYEKDLAGFAQRRGFFLLYP